MTAKFSAARRDAFLAALAATGNQTIAAERAKVSSSWVHLHQSTDPLFRDAMDEAIRDAKEALRAAASAPGGGRAPAEALRWHDGAELVVRGTNGRRTQIGRARVKQWSPRAETRFLATLAATCNVKAACAEVGLTPASAYGHRNRWPTFRARWDEALETGYCRLEMALLENAVNLFSAPDYPRDEPLPEMTPDHALRLLHMHKHQVHGIGKAPGRAPPPPDLDEMRASILRKIEAVKRWEARQAEKEAAREVAGIAGAPPAPESAGAAGAQESGSV